MEKASSEQEELLENTAKKTVKKLGRHILDKAGILEGYTHIMYGYIMSRYKMSGYRKFG
jgi:hypothetical protein